MAKILSSCLFLFSLLSSFLPISTSSTIFNFTSFTPNTPDIIFSGDAFPSGENVIQLTRNQADSDLLQSSGQAIYASPIQIWDPATHMATDFITHFRFIVKGLDELHFGDGLAFFMAPVGSKLPENSTGKWLGLFNSTTNNATSTRLVAVEFDTFKNEWDPSANHIGINVNTIISVTNMTWNSNIKSGEIGSAWIGYNSTAKNFYVYLTYGGDSYDGIPSLSYSLDLMEVLPNEVVIGFSAATGSSTELHKILSWDLVSSFSSGNKNNKAGHKKRHWVAAFVVMVLVSIAGFCFGVMFWRRKKKGDGDGDGDMKDFDSSMEDKFVKETGPRRFTYKQLASATKNFSEDGKLGQGGFGEVFKGVLDDNGAYEIVAVKKISKGSSQGQKEYVSEVTVISRLRHRNLVRLIGWCHEYSEFLLVYEYMPNGSLDSHIFGKKTSLMWTIRFKIALGLASALLYLHEEWEQCVVHRDIKSSNVMLDSSFNAKLGDFGLARFVDHGLGSQTTVLAGTMGYLAPECITIGKASKESDVYSFGVVALEIACGRKAVEPQMEEPKVRLVEWVWDLYGCGRLLDAADERLSAHFEEKQMERLMIVGLWCAYPDQKLRPSIRQVIQVLSFEAALPSLPAKMPVPMYLVPPIDMWEFTNTTNLGQQCMKDHSCCSCTSSCNTSRTMRSSGGASSKFLLNTDKEVDQPHILLRTEV